MIKFVLQDVLECYVIMDLSRAIGGLIKINCTIYYNYIRFLPLGLCSDSNNLFLVNWLCSVWIVSIHVHGYSISRYVQFHPEVKFL